MCVGGSADGLRERIAAWPGVEVREGGERGLRFCVCRGEFLHFHGDRQLDLRLSIGDRDRALAEGRAQFHPRAHEGGWVIVRLEEASPAEAIRLAAAAYRARVRARR